MNYVPMHDTAGNSLARIRELTCDYVAPANACNTYRAALDGLRALEGDMHLKVHKEYSMLFPNPVECESEFTTLNASR